MNMRTITFNELRKIKDSLPSGSITFGHSTSGY